MRKHGFLAKESDIMAIIRRIDLDGDARIGKEEFIKGLMPEQPYSKALTRQIDKERSRPRNNGCISILTGQNKVQVFDDRTNYNSLDLASAQSGPLNVDVGKHLLFRKENLADSIYGKKPKVVIPNCALIVPQRYKKGYEENMDKKYIKKMEDK